MRHRELGLQPSLLPSRLTAFVLKILSLAQEQVGDSPEKLQQTAGWLLAQQLGDGSFHDPRPVIHRGMQVRACYRSLRMSTVRLLGSLSTSLTVSVSPY